MKRLTTLSIGILVLIIISVLIISCTPPEPIEIGIFSYNIKGCAKTGEEFATKSRAPETPKDPKIEVIGNEIKYSRALFHHCCRKVEVDKAIIDQEITFVEIWTGPHCKCKCFSEIEATITDLPAGEHTVKVMERGFDADESTPTGQMGTKDLISEKVIVKGKIVEESKPENKSEIVWKETRCDYETNPEYCGCKEDSDCAPIGNYCCVSKDSFNKLNKTKPYTCLVDCICQVLECKCVDNICVAEVGNLI